MSNRHRHGFVLGELIIVLVISGVVVVALLAGLIALIRGLQPQAVKINGEPLPIAPSFGSFPSAVRLHQALTARTTQARATYVFGGRHVSLPAGAPPAAVQPLKLQRLPAITDFGPGLPLDAATFYERYASSLGEQESAAAPDDFTILMVGPAAAGLAVTCLVQVRRRDVEIADGDSTLRFVVRETQLWDDDGDALRYAQAEPPASAARVFVGAVHTWMRYSSSPAVAEEGPACVVFPDPWVYAGSRGRADDIPPFSRFSYFLPVSP